MRDQQTKREFLNGFFYTVFKRKVSLVILFFAFFGVILFGTYLITPTYEATTKILVHMNPSQQLILFRDLASPSQVNPRINPVNNLIQISKGQSIAEEMVKTFELDKRLRERREHPTELRDRMKNGFASVMKSPLTFAQKLGLLRRKESDYQADAVEKFIKNIQDVTLEEDTEIVNLTIYGENPELASNMANFMALLLIQKTKELTQIEASGAYEFTREQVSMAEESLREAEDKLSQFKEREGIVSLSEEKKGDLERLASLETEFTWTNASLGEVRRQLSAARENAISATIIKNNPTIGNLVTSLNSLEIQYASLQQTYTENHPEVAAIKAQISENRARLHVELNAVLNGLGAKKEALRAEIDSLRGRIDAIPRKEVELARLERKVSALQDRAKTLRSKLLELEVQQVSQMGEFDIKIIDEAYIPRDAGPDHPNWLLHIAMGIIASIVAAFICIFGVEYWNDSLRNAEEAEGLLKVPTMGVVPNLSQKKRALRKREVSELPLVFDNDKFERKGVPWNRINSKEGERAHQSFGLIVDNLLFKRAAKEGDIFLVTSSCQREGKTTVAVNLALLLAHRGNRILLIDANVRAPRIDTVLGLNDSHGLVQLLRHEVPDDDTIQRNVVDNLNVVTTGRTQTTFFDPLWLRELEPFLHDFQKTYDVIILDSAPIETYVDILILTPYCDGVILVVRADQTQREKILSTKDKIEETGGNILGCVLNRYRNPIPRLLRGRLQLSSSPLGDFS